MPKVDIKRRCIRAKIVYYGPGLSGKTTNILYVRDHLAPKQHGRLRTLNSDRGSGQVIEVLPVQFQPLRDFKMIYNLCTVPGKASLNKTRQKAIKGVDGVVFVADSRRPRILANVDSLQNLRENLEQLDIHLENVPHVLQYNQRDRPNAAPVTELRSQLNSYGVLEFETIATQGQGVMETMKAITRKVREDMQRRL